MPFVRLASLSELEIDQGHRVELSDDGEVAVALVRTGDGVYAVEDRCSHEDYPLSEGWSAPCTAAASTSPPATRTCRRRCGRSASSQCSSRATTCWWTCRRTGRS
jgi:hypothetical protein